MPISPGESKILTLIIIGLLTPFSLVYWLWILKPLTVRTTHGRASMGMRVGSGKITTTSVKISAVAMAVCTLALSAVVYFWGYGWWFGGGAYGGLGLTLMLRGYVPIVPKRFRFSMSILAWGTLPLPVALALGWLDFCGWINLPKSAFFCMNMISLFVFAWLAGSSKIYRE